MTLSSKPAARAWCVVAPPPIGPFDGVTDFSRALAAAVNAIEPARLAAHADLANVEEIRGVLLQYSPPAFVRPGLPRLLRQLSRLRARGVPVVTTVHEYWPPAARSVKRAVWRWLCRRSLAAVAARSSRVVATTPYAAKYMSEAGIARGREIAVVPVPSNIAPSASAPTTSPVGAAPVIAMFGQPYVFDRAVVAGLATWIAARSPRPRWIWIARSNAEMTRWWREIGAPEVVEFHGELPAADVSALIAQATIGVALYDDGASTRRSSLAALLAHGLPVVGLDGRFTDDRLRQSGALLLSPLGDPQAVIANLQRVMDDDALRLAMSAAATRLYERDLTWPVVAAAHLALLRGSAPGV